MKPTKWIPFAASVPLSVVGWSQEFPRSELGFDYSYVRHAPSAAFTRGHSLNGAGGTLVFNVNQFLGLKADLLGYRSSTNTFVITRCPLFPSGAAASVKVNLFTDLFGPQIEVRSSKLQPFVHLLVGGAHSNLYADAFESIGTPRLGACAFSRAPYTQCLCDGIWRWHRYSGASAHRLSQPVQQLQSEQFPLYGGNQLQPRRPEQISLC